MSWWMTSLLSISLGWLGYGHCEPTDGLDRGPDRTGEEAKIHQRGEVAVPLRQTGTGRGVLDDGDLEALLDEFAQMAFDAQVGGHSREDDLADAPFAQLQDEIVRLGADNLVRRGDHGAPVVDVMLVSGKKIGARACEAVHRIGVCSREHSDAIHELLQRIAEAPLLVGRIEVVRRHRDGDSGELRGVEQFANVGDGVVRTDAVAEHRPRSTFWAEE